MAGTNTTDRLWTIAEAAQYLCVPVSAIYKMTARTARLRIPHVRLAGRLRFRQADLERWVDLMTVSNVDVLEKARNRMRRHAHGDDPQETASQR